MGVAFDCTRSTVYIAEPTVLRAVTATGTVKWTQPLAGGWGIAIDTTTGRVYVSQYLDRSIGVYESSGVVVRNMTAGSPGKAGRLGSFYGPAGIALHTDSAGWRNLIVADADNNRFQVSQPTREHGWRRGGGGHGWRRRRPRGQAREAQAWAASLERGSAGWLLVRVRSCISTAPSAPPSAAGARARGSSGGTRSVRSAWRCTAPRAPSTSPTPTTTASPSGHCRAPRPPSSRTSAPWAATWAGSSTRSAWPCTRRRATSTCSTPTTTGSR